jgi:hypothetical protein
MDGTTQSNYSSSNFPKKDERNIQPKQSNDFDFD